MVFNSHGVLYSIDVKQCMYCLGMCEIRKCQNGGTCINVKTDYVCKCRDKYEGKNCGIGNFIFLSPSICLHLICVLHGL